MTFVEKIDEIGLRGSEPRDICRTEVTRMN